MADVEHERAGTAFRLREQPGDRQAEPGRHLDRRRRLAAVLQREEAQAFFLCARARVALADAFERDLVGLAAEVEDDRELLVHLESAPVLEQQLFDLGGGVVGERPGSALHGARVYGAGSVARLVDSRSLGRA